MVFSTILSGDLSNGRRVDALINSKLRLISTEERSLGMEDLHGVADVVVVETPELVEQKIESMTSALLSISENSTDPAVEAYRSAMSMSPDYVDKLKLAFLRSETYDTTSAASRLIRFFDFKLQHFGIEKLVQDIKLQDLTGKEEVDAVRKGLVQILPQRDRAGRSVIFLNGKASTLYSDETMMRILFGMAMIALEDGETQQNGVVGIYYGVGQEYNKPGSALQLWKTWTAIPWRSVAFHVCINTFAMNNTSYELCTAMSDRDICRFRLHNGTTMECLFNLATFGISRDTVPVNMLDGSIALISHRLMLEALKSRDTASPKNEVIMGESILVPCPMDIIMGRGRKPRGSPGVMRFHAMLAEYSKAYEAASKGDKTVIAQEVLERLKESGCRFLNKLAKGRFVESDDWSAREKISHDFRNLRMKISTSYRRSKSGTSRGSNDLGASKSRKLQKLAKTQNVESSPLMDADIATIPTVLLAC